MMTFITRGGKGREDKNKDRKATRSEGGWPEERLVPRLDLVTVEQLSWGGGLLQSRGLRQTGQVRTRGSSRWSEGSGWGNVLWRGCAHPINGHPHPLVGAGVDLEDARRCANVREFIVCGCAHPIEGSCRSPSGAMSTLKMNECAKVWMRASGDV